MLHYIRRKLSKRAETDETSIGNILIECHWVTPEQLRTIADLQKNDSPYRMGQLFVKLEIITQAQLSEALSLQRQRRGKASRRDVAKITIARHKRSQQQLKDQFDEIGQLARQVAAKG